MQYMVVERFTGGAAAVYARARERGRMLPEGVTYVTSWVDTTLSVCFQVMEARERGLLDAWMARWSDLVEFEVWPVLSSAEAAKAAEGGA